VKENEHTIWHIGTHLPVSTTSYPSTSLSVTCMRKGVRNAHGMFVRKSSGLFHAALPRE
jgi:hypothetical protein